MLFSKEALIQFVFANERTDVFWNSIFQTKLDRYLFYRLLEDDYPLAYFIDYTNGKLSVYHYVKTDTENYCRRILGGSQGSQLAKWILKKFIKKQQQCAMVVHLNTFCRLFEKEANILQELAKKHKEGKCFGTIVLVGSHNADKNLTYLMESPVFEYLHEDAVLQLRSARKIDNLYSVLETYRQRQNCFFLNRYTRESITDLVNGVAVCSTNYYPGTERIQVISNYLTRYLNCPDMQMSEKRIFDREVPFICPSYQEICQQLKKKDIWTLLCRQSAAYEQTYPEMLKNDKVDMVCQSAHFIYDDNSIQMKCMKLCVPGALCDNLYDSKTIEKLNQIYNIVRLSGNRPVNPKIAAKVDDFIMMFNSAGLKSDKDTCFRIASGILLFVKWMTIDDDKEVLVLKIIGMTETFVRASAKLFNLQKLNTGLITAQQKQIIEELQAYLLHFDTTFSSLSINVELSVTDVMQNMQEVIRQLPVVTSDDYAGIKMDEEDSMPGVKTQTPSYFEGINIYDDD